MHNPFKRFLPADPAYMEKLRNILRTGSYDEFVSTYDPSYLKNNYWGKEDTMLSIALGGNCLSAEKIKKANRLLDDGVDVRKGRPLHAFLGSHSDNKDIAREAALLRRLIEAGADINELYGTFGTPLESLALQFKYSDDELRPFYDVFFDQDNLDFMAVRNKQGDTTYDMFMKLEKFRSALNKRIISYMQEHGQAPPSKT